MLTRGHWITKGAVSMFSLLMGSFAEDAATSFNYAGSDVADQVVILNYTKGTAKESCCGAIVMENEKPYLVTLQSALWGSGKMSFKTTSGRSVKPKRIEVALDSNLMRMELAEGEGLALASDVAMGDEIGVFGKNSDRDAVSELYGTVKGVGGDVLEVSAEFDEEHVGAPVLDHKGHLLALANYARESGSNSMLKGTRFANQTRRFCCRLGRVKWKAISWGPLNKKYGVVYAENDRMIQGISGILEDISDGPLDSVEVDGEVGKHLTGWMSAHNQLVQRHPGTGNRRHKFYNDYAASAEKLASVCRSQARKAEMIAKIRGLTPFMQNSVEDQAQTLEYFAEIVEFYGAQTYDD